MYTHFLLRICTYQPPYQPPEGGNDDLPVWEEKVGVAPEPHQVSSQFAALRYHSFESPQPRIDQVRVGGPILQELVNFLN